MTETDRAERRSYANPPIVEAVIELRFGGQVGADFLFKAVTERLGGRYAGKRREQHRIDLTASLSEDAIDTTAERRTHLRFLVSEDGRRLVGCGEGLLTIHVLAPYPGWESFAEQMQEAVDAVLASSDSVLSVSTVAVRYIDRIPLPPDQPFETFFTIIPACPDGMPPGVAGFQYLTQTVDEDGTLATLILATAGRQNDGHLAILYDLNLVRSSTDGWALDGTDWGDVVEQLHTRQRFVFESSITETLRETFE